MYEKYKNFRKKFPTHQTTFKYIMHYKFVQIMLHIIY